MQMGEKKMKKQFEDPIMEIIKFTAEDVMTLSTAILRDDELGIYELK